MNLLILTLKGGFGFFCLTDDACAAGFYLDSAPLPKIWPIYK